MRRGALRLAVSLFAGILGGSALAECGEVVTLPVRDGVTLRYVLSTPVSDKPAAALLLLAGGSGHLALDAGGCPKALAGNSLVRSKAIFLKHGFATAYVDAPSDHTGEDGLGGFRTTPQHAADLGRAIADLRRRTGVPIWVAGTSRGAISAANTATRLQGNEAPDGVVLTSPVTVGNPQGRKSWVAQSVFDLPLEAIRMPLLLVAHVEDACLRSPASMIDDIAARSPSTVKQVVKVSGGPGASIAPGLAACEARSPHGFIEQEEEVAAGIARFVRGGRY
jgi:hypothetical protein